MAAGTAGAIAVAWRIGQQAYDGRAVWGAVLPWCLVLLVVGLAAIYVFLQPMEMRGNVLG